MTCSRCEDRGSIQAWHRFERGSGAFIFKCTCIRSNPALPAWVSSRAFPEWSSSYEAKFIPEWIDKPPTHHWLKFAKPESEEFKKRIKIWGRDWFVAMWKELKSNGDLAKDEVVETSMPMVYANDAEG
jgi:hypothetical protein